MKHIQLYESYTEEQVRKVLSKDDIKLNVSVDEVINRLNYKKENRFGFDGFVDSEGEFISESDKDDMGEYIEKFKELGLDTKKIEELYPDFKKYSKLIRSTNNWGSWDINNNKIEYDRLNSVIDDLEPSVDEFNKEIRILAKKANQL